MIQFSGKNGLTLNGVEVDDRLLLRTAWMTMLCACAASMAIHALSGNARAIPFFISESDFPGLERIVFRGGLNATGLMLCFLALRLPHALDLSHNTRLRTIAQSSGIITGISTILLSWFSMHDHLVIHVIFASITFVGAYVWSYTMHASNSHKRGSGYAKRRVWLTIGGLSYLVMNLALAESARQLVLEQGLTGGTEVMNLAQSSINIAAPAEYLFFFSVVMILASFDHDLAEARQDERLVDSSS